MRNCSVLENIFPYCKCGHGQPEMYLLVCGHSQSIQYYIKVVMVILYSDNIKVTCRPHSSGIKGSIPPAWHRHCAASNNLYCHCIKVIGPYCATSTRGKK